MRPLLKSTLFALGIARLVHRWRNRGVLTVVMFHRVLPPASVSGAGANPTYTVSPDEFSACLDFFARWYAVVSLDQVRHAAAGGSLPACPLLITLDDGWRDNVQHALPALSSRGLPALLFVATGHVGAALGFWQEQVFARVLAGPGNRAANLAKAARLVEDMAKLPEADRAARVAELPVCALPRQMADVHELRAMQDAGIAIGGHGHSHQPLTDVTDPPAELAACRADLAEWGLGGERPAFSFPHGRATPRLIAEAGQAGFGLCFTSAEHLVLPGALTDAAGIGRISIDLAPLRREGGFDLPALAFSLLTRPHRSVAR